MEGDRKLTLNYGVRYDVELSRSSRCDRRDAAAEKALGVSRPFRATTTTLLRASARFDPTGSARPHPRWLRALYDHPLLATAFDSVTADGGRSVQLLSAGGRAICLWTCHSGIRTGWLCDLRPTDSISPTNLNGSANFPGRPEPVASMFYLPDQQR